MTHRNIFIHTTLTLTLALVGSTAGCGGSDGAKDAAKAEAKAEADPAAAAVETETGDAPQFADDVERAVAVAREIMKAPESADEILARYELDRPGLDELIYKIASDPESRKRYADMLAARD